MGIVYRGERRDCFNNKKMDLFKHFECLSGPGDALNSRTSELKNWDCVVWIGPGECRGVV